MRDATSVLAPFAISPALRSPASASRSPQMAARSTPCAATRRAATRAFVFDPVLSTYHGVLAPAAEWRDWIVPGSGRQKTGMTE